MALPFARSVAQTRPTFSRDFAGLKTLDHGAGPAITFTRASNATFFNASGVLQTASNDQPRFDHDPATGASLGLLIEESRTNLLERSAEFDNAYWTQTNVTVTANAVAAPDGNTAADSVFETTTNGFHVIARSGVATVDAVVTASIFAKANGRTKLAIQIGGLNSVEFDLSAATATVVNATGGTSGSIVSVGNGWFRCIATRQSTINGAVIFLLSNGSTYQYAGNTALGMYWWGAQLEAGAFPTSYIPTTSAAATRSADSAVVTPISSFYNQSEGTLFAEASSMTAVTGTRVALAASDGSDNNVMRLYGTDTLTAFNVRVSASSVVDRNFAAASANTVFKIIGAYRQDDFAASFNGGAASLDGSGAVPSVTTLSIGQAGHTAGKIMGHIRKIAYWPRRLSNTLLQQLTT